MNRVEDLKEVAKIVRMGENRVGGGKSIYEGRADASEATEGFQLFGIIASIFGGEEVNDVVEGFAEVPGEIALIDGEGRGNRQFRNRRKGESRIDSGIVIRERRATRGGSRSHEEEPKV